MARTSDPARQPAGRDARFTVPLKPGKLTSIANRIDRLEETAMQKAIWLSFDLGVKGDYESLYAWLDNHGAIECGDSTAFLKYEVGKDASSEQLLKKLQKDLRSAVDFSKTDRLYVAYRGDDTSLKGRFLFGKRKAAPWQGYGDAETGEDA